VKESKRVRCSLEEKAVNNNHGAPNHAVYIESLVEMLAHTIMGATLFISHQITKSSFFFLILQ